MDKDVVEIKISYGSVNHFQTKKEYLEVKDNKVMDFSLNQILEDVNQFIETQDIQTSFLQILFKTKNGFQNIYHLLEQENNEIQIQREGDKFIVEIQLRDFQENSDHQILAKYEREQAEFQAEENYFRDQIKEKQKKLQQENKHLIDLAFFYAEPLIQRIDKKEKAVGKQVSFQKQTIQFTKMLKTRVVLRATNIEINVATQKNLNRTLDSKIKILHFSCHGQNTSLLLQSEDQLGLLWRCSTENLIHMLQYNPPQIIVFNVCNSSQIAKKLFDHFEGKMITIGYTGKANDQECAIFTEIFYTQIFQGKSVIEVFQFAKSKMKKNKQKLVIYQNSNMKISSSKIGSNEDSLIAIENQHEPMEQDVYSINMQLYQFIKHFFLSTNQEVICFNGDREMGKSLFTKKVCLYLKQRSRIDQHLFINLQSSIGSLVEFRIVYQEKIEKFFKENDNKNIVLVIDHCDLLIKLQGRQFQNFIYSQLLKKMRGKIILIFEDTASFHFSPKVKFYKKRHFEINEFRHFQDFIKFQKKSPQFSQRNDSKKINSEFKKINKTYKPKMYFDSFNWILQENEGNFQGFADKLKEIDSLTSISKEENKMKIRKEVQEKIQNIQNFTKQVTKVIENKILDGNIKIPLTEFPVIDFLIYLKLDEEEEMPELVLESRPSKIEENFRDNCERFLNEIEYIFNKISQKNCLINKQRRFKKIVKSMHCLVNFKYFILKEVESYEQKYWEEFKKLIHKCISLCLILKAKESYFTEKSELEDLNQYHYFMIKMYMYLIMATMNEDSLNYSTKKNQIYFYSLLEVVSQKQGQIIKNLLFLYKEYFLQIEPDKIEELQFGKIIYQKEKIEEFYRRYKLIKESFSEKFLAQVDDQKIFGENQLKQLGLIFVKLAYGYLKSKEYSISYNQTSMLLDRLEECSFLLEKNPEIQYISCLKQYQEKYINIMFQLQKIAVKNPIHSKNKTRIEIVGIFDNLIEACKNHSIKALRQIIEIYKSESFNSCAALTSFPVAYKESFKNEKIKRKKNGFPDIVNKKKYVLVNPLRFSSKIDRVLVNSFQKISKAIYTRVDCFSQKTLTQYKEDNLPILLSFFFVDCKNTENEDECILFLEDENGLSQPIRIQELNFFHSYVSIFCGAHVQKIKQYVQRYKKDENKVYIFLNSSLKDIGDETGEIYDEIYFSIKNRILIMKIFEQFCETFCEMMFNHEYENILEQINISFEIAKQAARLKTNDSYASVFYQEIEEFIERIQICNNKNKEKEFQPPLKVSEGNRSKKVPVPTKEILDLGYNSELIKFLTQLNQERQGGKKYIVIYSPQRQALRQFLECLKTKIKKMGIFANGIRGEEWHSSNTCTSTVYQSKKKVIEDEVMYVYEEKSRKRIQMKIGETQIEQTQYINKVFLFTTTDEAQKHSEYGYTEIALNNYSEYNVIVSNFLQLICLMPDVKKCDEMKLRRDLLEILKQKNFDKRKKNLQNFYKKLKKN